MKKQITIFSCLFVSLIIISGIFLVLKTDKISDNNKTNNVSKLDITNLKSQNLILSNAKKNKITDFVYLGGSKKTYEYVVALSQKTKLKTVFELPKDKTYRTKWDYIGVNSDHSKIYIAASNDISENCGKFISVYLQEDDDSVIVSILGNVDKVNEANAKCEAKMDLLVPPILGYIELKKPLGNRTLYHGEVGVIK